MNRIIIAGLISIIGMSKLWAQQPKDTLNTEVISVVKPYSPTISDAFKINDLPVIQEEDIDKKNIEYHINSIPVASTFTPSKGKAKGVTRPKKERLFDNYISAGFGNYTTPFLEAYIRTFPGRDGEFGVLLKHHSSQGGIKDVLLDDSFYKTNLDVYYKQSNRDMDWKINLDVNHRLYNWYGLPESTTFDTALLSAQDPKHTFLNVGVGGEINYFNSFFKGAKLSLSNFSDNYNSGEIHLRIEPEFEMPISSELINFKFDVNFLNGSMERNYANSSAPAYSYLNLGVSPNFEVLRENLRINLGAKLYYALDFEKGTGAFKAYPSVDASFQLIDQVLTLFAGATGGLHLNSYADFTKDNPFVSPTISNVPTDEKYRIFTGVKGKLASNINYLLKGSYADEQNKPLFLLNQIKSDGTSLVNESYELGNSFGVVYDGVKTIRLYGELAIDFSKEFTFGGNVNYALYDMDTQPEAWNLPNLKTTLFADYHQQKWVGSAKLFMVDKRWDTAIPYGIVNPVPEDYKVDLGVYLDLNAELAYAFTERLSAFAKTRNLLSTKYKRFYNYPVQGLQVLGGLTYKFDL